MALTATSGWRWIVVAAAGVLAGCSTFERVKIGQSPREYDSALPASASRRTALGIISLDEQIGGRQEAMLVLVGKDRRVCGRFRTLIRPDGLLRSGEFVFEGELDPVAAGLGGAGPRDALRSVLSDLLVHRGERRVNEGHDWIAIGLLRTLEREDAALIVDLPTERLARLMQHVPRGGQGEVRMDELGRIRCAYRVADGGS